MFKQINTPLKIRLPILSGLTSTRANGINDTNRIVPKFRDCRIFVFVKTLLCLLLVISFKDLLGAGGEVSGADYLKLGMDARGIALGRAYTALASGSAAIYWNPSGLLNPEVDNTNFDIQTTYKSITPWDDSYITFAMAWRARRFALGIGYVHYGVKDIPEYDDYMNYRGKFNNLEQALLVGIALDFPGLFQIGITNIVLTQLYDGLQSSDGSQRYGWGINLGLKFRPIVSYDRLEIGVQLSDEKSSGYQDLSNVLGGEDSGDIETSSIFINAGVKWEFWHRPLNNYLSSMILLTDVEQERDFPIKLKLGMEVNAVQIGMTTFFIRGGIDDWILEMRDLENYPTESKLKEFRKQIVRLNRKFTMGMGIHYKLFIVDYAWVRETFRNMHFITLKLVL